MTVPLAHYLTSFSAPLAVAFDNLAVAEPPVALVTLTAEDFEARISAARADATAQTAALYAAEAAAAAEVQSAAIGAALASARAEWSAIEGVRLAALVETTAADLRTLLSDRLAAVLRPWLVETARARAQTGAVEAIDRLLADANSARLEISGPEDLVTAMRAARPNLSVEWQVTEAVDVTIVADSTRIETRLAAALADLTAER